MPTTAATAYRAFGVTYGIKRCSLMCPISKVTQKVLWDPESTTLDIPLNARPYTLHPSKPQVRAGEPKSAAVTAAAPAARGRPAREPQPRWVWGLGFRV